MIGRFLEWYGRGRPGGAALLVVLAAAAPALAAAASPRYVASPIAPDDEIRGFWVADFDGSGRQDLLISTWSEARGRELALHLQDATGRFAPTPSRRIEVNREIIAFALADTRATPGTELIFLTRTAAYSFSTASASYAGNLAHLFDWDFLLAVPRRQDLLYLGTLSDVDGDGRLDLLLPGRERFGLFLADGPDSFRLAARLPRPHRSPARAETTFSGLAISASGLNARTTRPSAFTGLVVPPAETPSAILDISRWAPVVVTADMTGNGRLDLAYLDDVEETERHPRRLNLLLQDDDRTFSASPDWQSELAVRDGVQLVDVDGDGVMDVMTRHQTGADEMTLRFYRNRGGRFDFQTPDAVMRFSGYDVEADVVDLTGNGRPELIVSYYSISAVGALRDGSVTRTLLIYVGSGDTDADTAPFARRPNARLEERFSASAFLGLTQRISFAADVTGDGRRDAVSIDNQGALIARRLGDSLGIDDAPFWRFVPSNVIQDVHAVDLNGDARSDFVLTHQHSLTVLVSLP